MNHVAGRGKHSAQDVVRTLRRADELAASVNAVKELKDLREQNSRLKRLLAEAELAKDALAARLHKKTHRS